MIANEIVQDIISSSNIVEVVKDYVDLKETGTNYSGLCPFHNEKTGSFVVSPSKGIFKCFGCGESGNSAGFLMKHKGISFPEAIKELGKKYNIEVPERKRTDEEIAKDNKRGDLFALNTWAMKYFENKLKSSTEAKNYIENRFTNEEYAEFNIGYADNSFTSLIDAAIHSGFTLNLLLDAGLISKKADKHYDFFIDRLIFPIISLSGQVIGFNGRQLKINKEYGKYINVRNTEVFNKSRSFYGINSAIKSIRELKYAIIVEGNTDVMRMQLRGFPNTIAPLGTSFTIIHAEVLKRFVNRAVLIMDGDSAGSRSNNVSAYKMLSKGIIPQIVVLPKGEDPDTFFKKEDRTEWFSENKSDFIMMMCEKSFDSVGNDPTLKAEAASEIGELLSLIEDDFILENYVSDIIKQYNRYGIGKRLLNKAILKHKPESTQNKQKVSEESLSGLTSKQQNDLLKYSFYEGENVKEKNQFMFGTGNNVSNFIIRPIFHVKSLMNTRKLFELENKEGEKIKIDIDMQEMTSLNAFRKVIEGQGNFIFEGNETQFMKIRSKLYDNTLYCEAIDYLGWQPEGFWAWANGIQTNDKFMPTDSNGIVKLKSKNYYIPAFSSIYIEDRTLFVEERKFKLIDTNISLAEWSELFVKVYGDNGKMGIAFWTATLFRDHILRIFKNFPLLNLFGPKGTGKSQMAMSMMALFGEPQVTANIHNITKAGLADHISRFINAFAWIDEYKNALDFDKIETLKSIYDSIGRSRMNMDKGKKKETTLVNSAVILSGQEMPTADIALFSRVIFLMFTQSEFDDNAKADYDKLKSIERNGLSNYSNNIIKHFIYFEQEFYKNYDLVLSELSKLLKDNGVEDRVLRNWASIIASFRVISQKIEFSFDYSDLIEVSIKGIITQTRQSTRSDEIGIFWDIMESLFDHDNLISGWNFKIDFCDSLKTKKNDIIFTEPKSVLKFKFSSIASLYSEYGRKMGIKTLPHDTLRTYLENHKYFIGVSKVERFRYIEFSKEDGQNMDHNQVTSAYCFDYDKLAINLERELETINFEEKT